MIEFHQLALQELRQAQAWYRERSLQAAERFFQQVNRTIQRMQIDPTSHAMIGRDCHYLRISRFPFAFIYRVNLERHIFIIAVAHTSRRRSYWRKRT